MPQTDALVVGLGVAGLNLCHALERAGRTFHVIDPCTDNSASWIAGGIYNPIVIKRKVKSWRVDELFPILEQTYAELDIKLGIASWHRVPIIKPIFSVDELHEWRTAAAAGTLAPYLTQADILPPQPPVRSEALATLQIRQSGHVQLPKLIAAYRAYLNQRGLLIKQTIDLNNFDPDYNLQAHHIFDCTGISMRHHARFAHLPLQPSKGQVISVTTPEALPEAIYNQHFYLLPAANGVHRLGATYDWADLYSGPTQAATDQLIERALKSLDLTLTPADAQSAVRPNVADRRPLIGTSPTNPSMHLFNGMGSKGVMLAPFFARQLVANVFDNAPLDAEVDLKRFL